MLGKCDIMCREQTRTEHTKARHLRSVFVCALIIADVRPLRVYSSNCQRARTAPPFCAELRHFSLKYVSIPAKKYLAQHKKFFAAGHIASFQIHPGKNEQAMSGYQYFI